MEAYDKRRSWRYAPAYLTPREFAMKRFFEHHKHSIRFAYQCLDRILLNAVIQPFQQAQRGIGFFWSYRHLYPVSRSRLKSSPIPKIAATISSPTVFAKLSLIK